ncbi:hypothetical protein R1X32_02675 (plasmid) [Rhodococcus opacus]|uniref:Uncharacterized protein n=1 Tax=Rhodococcus opacus TaxID=37919 RepID=A0ABT4NLF2_RHOOP|nr:MULTISPECIES: hypothetical protein [Rhodococcus]MCZ4588210.1 hypothetical protein [Rhodococcus opacus]MDI9940668.1 hypothetical protein [Rhodococcus sp. IEGM 1351]MDV6247405.1 hypothetical protein [Rhodococcus opacus]WKN61090.1 hypothetical protein HJ581_0046555 [Rhodococcus opacus]
MSNTMKFAVPLIAFTAVALSVGGGIAGAATNDSDPRESYSWAVPPQATAPEPSAAPPEPTVSVAIPGVSLPGITVGAVGVGTDGIAFPGPTIGLPDPPEIP